MSILRLPLAGSVGAVCTAALFFVLWVFVDTAPQRSVGKSFDVRRYERVLADTPVQPKTWQRRKAERKPVPNVPGLPSPTIDVPPAPPSIPTGTRGRLRDIADAGPVAPGFATSGVDGDATPLLRVLPQYPPNAALRNIEGWVRVRYTIAVNGSVKDVRVVAAEPENVFEKAALAAVARWRYEPRVVGGVPVERVGLETIVRFELPR